MMMVTVTWPSGLTDGAALEAAVFVLIALMVITHVGRSFLVVGNGIPSSRRRPLHEDYEQLRNLSVPQNTLFAVLQPHLVPMEEIQQEHDKLLRLIQLLLGINPTALMVLKIWPPAFRSYSTIVPNFLNLPEYLFGFGTRPKQLVTTAMYVSSRANECAYCTCHCCSFSVRRGSDSDYLQTLSSLLPQQNQGFLSSSSSTSGLSDQELAVAQVAYGLGKFPSTLQSAHVQELYKVLSRTPSGVEWIVGAIATFGSLNKLMDGLGIPLEPSIFAETRRMLGRGWSIRKAGSLISTESGADVDNASPPAPKQDNWKTMISALYLGLCPGGALSVNRKLLKGMPTTASEAMAFLDQSLGCPFCSVFEKLIHSRFIGAVAAVIRLNFSDEFTAGLTLHRKVLVGAIFAHTAGSHVLMDAMVAVGKRFGLEEKQVQDAVAATRDNDVPSQAEADIVTHLVLNLACALSVAPSQITEEHVDSIRRTGEVTPAMLVELVSFIGTLQMMYRIQSFYALYAA